MQPNGKVLFIRSHVNVAKYISERQELRRMKEHGRDIRLARTQNSAVSEDANETEHVPVWNQVKFSDHDPLWYTRWVKQHQ